MTKEILLYTSIYSYSAANFINELEANKGNDICVRGNCPGGDMFSTYGMIAKFAEHQGNKKIKVDGIAASAFAYLLLETPAEDVECLDVSSFLYHRAAMGYSVEDEKSITPQERQILDSINASIRSSMERRASSDKFKAITGTSYDDLFSMDDRKDVVLNAIQAKELGFVGKVIPMSASKKSEIIALSKNYNIAAFANTAMPTIEANEENKTKNKMTASEFKIANPEAYASIVAEGVSKEKSRTEAWMAFKDVDAETAVAGIKNDKEVDMSVIAQMSVKAMSKANLVKAEAENAPVIETPAKGEEKTDAELEVEANTQRVLAAMRLAK